jgi:hypothetical protein
MEVASALLQRPGTDHPVLPVLGILGTRIGSVMMGAQDLGCLLCLRPVRLSVVPSVAVTQEKKMKDNHS